MITKEDIKQLALESGFKLKEQLDGSLDLNPYVYDFANRVIEKVHLVTNNWEETKDE